MRYLVAAVVWNIEAALVAKSAALAIVEIQARRFPSDLPSQACTATQFFIAIK